MNPHTGEWEGADADEDGATPQASAKPAEVAALSDERILAAADKEFPRWREDIQEAFVLRVVRCALASTPSPAAEKAP